MENEGLYWMIVGVGILIIMIFGFGSGGDDLRRY